MTKTFLHVGCGGKRQHQTTRGFATADWTEIRFDIDPAARPDVVGTMTDMAAVASGSMAGLYSSHNIEHLYPHEVPVALAEFRRVLAPDGFAVITCPDLQSVCALVAADRLDEAAYTSPAGPITPLDILYGHLDSMRRGNLYMAHRTGFTSKTLSKALVAAGFATVALRRREAPYFDLYALAIVSPTDAPTLRAKAAEHFPA
jgi:ubiquinone/menaquinone biosynthesis C-methylase UbiE